VCPPDPDGTGPPASGTVSFTTTGLPDTEPPILLSGPEVKAATDTSLTVVWTTNEPSTSAVSYNDNSAFFTVNDTKLVIEHEVVLAGLMSATTYNITVSSTDLAGNRS